MFYHIRYYFYEIIYVFLGPTIKMKRSLFKRICRSFRFTAKFTGQHMEPLRKLPNKWLKKSSVICHETFKVTSETIVSEKRLSAWGMKARKRGFVFFSSLFWRKNFLRGFPKMEKLVSENFGVNFHVLFYTACSAVQWWNVFSN